METFWTVCINTFFFSPIPPKTEFSCLLLPIKAPAGIWLADPKHLTQKQKQTPLKIHWNKSYPLTRFFCARSFRVSTFCAEMSFRCRMFSFLTLYFQKPSHRHCSHICLELESRSHSGILKSSPVHSFRWRGKKKKSITRVYYIGLLLQLCSGRNLVNLVSCTCTGCFRSFDLLVKLRNEREMRRQKMLQEAADQT